MRKRRYHRHEVRAVHRDTVFPRQVVQQAVVKNLYERHYSRWNTELLELMQDNKQAINYKGDFPKSIRVGLYYQGKTWYCIDIYDENPDLYEETLVLNLAEDSSLQERMENLIEEQQNLRKEFYEVKRFLTILLAREFTDELLKEAFGPVLYQNAFHDLPRECRHFRELLPQEIGQEAQTEFQTFVSKHQHIIDAMLKRTLLNVVSF